MARQLALAAGALINGILVAHAPAAVPPVIIAPLCVCWPCARRRAGVTAR
jgi:hypothetical protein